MYTSVSLTYVEKAKIKWKYDIRKWIYDILFGYSSNVCYHFQDIRKTKFNLQGEDGKVKTVIRMQMFAAISVILKEFKKSGDIC